MAKNSDGSVIQPTTAFDYAAFVAAMGGILDMPDPTGDDDDRTPGGAT